MSEPITPTIAEYLEAIFNMLDEGKVVIAARVADRMAVSRPTVSATLRRMSRQALIEIGADNQIRLLPRGLELARQNIRRHRLAERFLADVLGLEWHQVHAEAATLERGLSPVIEAGLLGLLGNPTTCPHGNPIPGTDAARLPDNAITLDQHRDKDEVILIRITEEGERDLELLRRLQASGIVPGTSLRVSREGELLVVQSPNGMLTLLPTHARTLWVQPTH